MWDLIPHEWAHKKTIGRLLALSPENSFIVKKRVWRHFAVKILKLLNIFASFPWDPWYRIVIRKYWCQSEIIIKAWRSMAVFISWSSWTLRSGCFRCSNYVNALIAHYWETPFKTSTVGTSYLAVHDPCTYHNSHLNTLIATCHWLNISWNMHSSWCLLALSKLQKMRPAPRTRSQCKVPVQVHFRTISMIASTQANVISSTLGRRNLWIFMGLLN